jgi:hypothetical protein
LERLEGSFTLGKEIIFILEGGWGLGGIELLSKHNTCCEQQREDSLLHFIISSHERIYG